MIIIKIQIHFIMNQYQFMNIDKNENLNSLVNQMIKYDQLASIYQVFSNDKVKNV